MVSLLSLVRRPSTSFPFRGRHAPSQIRTGSEATYSVFRLTPFLKEVCWDGRRAVCP